MFCGTCFKDHPGICPKVINPTAPVTKGQRDELLRVTWGGDDVTLRSEDGVNFRGGTGEPGVLVNLVRLGDGRYSPRFEDQNSGNIWKVATCRSPEVAAAKLHREIKRFARAGKLRTF